MIESGLVSVSFRSSSAEEIVKAAKEANLNHIQWGSDIHAPCSDMQKLVRISDLCLKNGISCSYGTYFRFGQDNPNDLYDYIRAAKVLNTGLLRLWCGTKGSVEYTQSELNRIYADCKLAAKIAENEGVVLGLECHNFTLTDTKESAITLMREVNSPAFKMFWQPNQFKTAQENIEYAKLLAPFVVCVHVFNWNKSEKYPLAEAEEIWADYLTSFGGDILALLEFMPDDSIDSLTTESDSLRRIITRTGL